MLPSRQDFMDGFIQRFTPAAAAQLVRIFDEGAKWATHFCEENYPAGGYAAAQGVNRRQWIENKWRLTSFDGGLVPSSLDFKGNLLDGDERVSNFTLLRSKEVGLITCRVSGFNPVLRESKWRKNAANVSLNQPPLLPEGLRRFDMRQGNLEALYVARYWLDDSDISGSSVGDIDVVVLNESGRGVHCQVVDLREFASREPVNGTLPLPITLRSRPDQTPPLPGEEHKTDLAISFKKDGDKEN